MTSESSPGASTATSRRRCVTRPGSRRCGSRAEGSGCSLEPWRPLVALLQCLASPPRQDEDPLGANGHLPVGVAHLSLDDGLHALDTVDPGLGGGLAERGVLLV